MSSYSFDEVFNSSWPTGGQNNFHQGFVVQKLFCVMFLGQTQAINLTQNTHKPQTIVLASTPQVPRLGTVQTIVGGIGMSKAAGNTSFILNCSLSSSIVHDSEICTVGILERWASAFGLHNYNRLHRTCSCQCITLELSVSVEQNHLMGVQVRQQL